MENKGIAQVGSIVTRQRSPANHGVVVIRDLVVIIPVCVVCYIIGNLCSGFKLCAAAVSPCIPAVKGLFDDSRASRGIRKVRAGQICQGLAVGYGVGCAAYHHSFGGIKGYRMGFLRPARGQR